MTMLTFYCLFFDDIRILVLPEAVDNYFFSLTTFSAFVFLIEIILSFIARKEYRFSFFFWLDVVSTLSLVFDLDWFTDRLTQNVVNTT